MDIVSRLEMLLAPWMHERWCFGVTNTWIITRGTNKTIIIIHLTADNPIIKPVDQPRFGEVTFARIAENESYRIVASFV